MSAVLAMMFRRNLTVDRAWRLIFLGAALGLALRVVLASAFVEHPSGDTFWYEQVARTLVREGLAGADIEKFDRPPLYPAFLATMIRMFGDGYAPPTRIAQCFTSATTVVSVGSILLTLVPSRPVVAVVAAWMNAMDPWAANFTKELYTENLTNPAFLALVALALRATEHLSWRRAVALGVLGAVQLHVRIDTVVIVVLVFVLGFWRSHIGGRSGDRDAGRWALACGLSLALCAPWSMFATARTGEPMLVASTGNCSEARANRGWFRFMSTVTLPREQWLGITWWTSRQCPGDWIPSAVFRSPDEEAEVRDIMRRSAAAGAPVGEPRLDAIAGARIDAAPLRYYIWNPIWRSASIWLDPTDSDRPLAIRHSARSIPGKVHDAATALWVVLGGLGFLVAWRVGLRPFGPMFPLGALVLARTYSILTAGLVTTGQALFERRYMTCVEPLAQGLAVWAALCALERITRGRRAVADTN